MRKITVIFISILFFISLEATEVKELVVEIIKLTTIKDAVTVKYKVSNLTAKTIWVCINNNQEKLFYELHPKFKLNANSKKKSLTIGMHSFNYNGMMIDGPFGAIYTPVKGKSSKNFELSFKFPVWERKVLVEKNESDKKFDALSEFKRLILEIGYYTNDLNKLQKCCYPILPKSELKKVSYKWAQKNKEKIAETTFDLKKSVLVH